MSRRPVYYLPISDPDVLLERCETLLRSLLQRIIERYINGHSKYTDDARVSRVRITKLEIEFTTEICGCMNILINSIIFFVLGIVACIIAGTLYRWHSEFNVVSLLKCLINADTVNRNIDKP